MRWESVAPVSGNYPTSLRFAGLSKVRLVPVRVQMPRKGRPSRPGPHISSAGFRQSLKGNQWLYPSMTATRNGWLVATMGH